MKIMAGSSQRAFRDNRTGGQIGAGWQEKAVHQRSRQQRAYHNQENKEMIQRVIAKVVSL